MSKFARFSTAAAVTLVLGACGITGISAQMARAEAAALPNENCAFCHTANATEDMVFTKFYPVLKTP